MRAYRGLFSLFLSNIDKDQLKYYVIFLPILGIVFFFVYPEDTSLMFTHMAIFMIPFNVLIKSDSDLWLRYQHALPITRKQMVTSFYLHIILSSLVGIPFVAIYWGVWSMIQYDGRELILTYRLSWIALGYTTVFMMTASRILLRVTPLSMRLGFFVRAVGVAIGGILGALMIGYLRRIGLSTEIGAYISLAISAAIFIISCMAARRLYGKLDF